VGDIEELIQVFFKRFNEKQKRDLQGFTPEAMEVLFSYSWPGNIRELENVMERVVTLESGKLIQVSTLPPEMVHAVRKAAGVPRELVLRANFALGPVDLEKVLDEVRLFYKKEALIYTTNDETLAETLIRK
jgi:DNA-binding NtrC family response regulator